MCVGGGGDRGWVGERKRDPLTERSEGNFVDDDDDDKDYKERSY